MGDLDVQKYLFDLQGYLVIDDILGAGEVASLNRLLDERFPHEPVDELPESQFGRGGGGVIRTWVIDVNYCCRSASIIVSG